MKVAVIGGSRGIGQAFIEQALASSLGIRALARYPDRFPVQHERLSLEPGDLMDAESVSRLIAGQDAVILTPGIPPTRKPVHLFSQGALHVLHAMEQHRVNRLLAITGIGAGNSKGHGGFLYDRIVWPLLLKPIYEDKDREETIIQGSRVNWTIIRPGFLNNGKRTEQYTPTTDLTGYRAGSISRADVAHFMLAQLTSDEFAGKIVMI